MTIQEQENLLVSTIALMALMVRNGMNPVVTVVLGTMVFLPFDIYTKGVEA